LTLLLFVISTIPLPYQIEDVAKVAHNSERIFIIDKVSDAIWAISRSTGELLGSYKKKGSGPGEYHTPTRIRYYNDRLIITAPLARKLVFLKPDLTFDWEWRLSQLCQEILWYQDVFYLVMFDPVSKTAIQAFDKDRKLIGQFGTGLPNDIVLSGSQSGLLLERKGKLYWLQNHRHIIEVYSTSGELEEKLTLPGTEGGYVTVDLMMGRKKGPQRFYNWDVTIQDDIYSIQLMDYHEKWQWMLSYSFADRSWSRDHYRANQVSTGHFVYKVKMNEEDFPQTLTPITLLTGEPR